jgi:uncharacterized protein YbjT (DUF2867 family)
VVNRLRSDGHEVRSLSRRPGAGTHVGDLSTGDGLGPALSGVEVIVHAASDTRRFGRRDEAQTSNLLQAARSAGSVQNLVYISIVGIDRISYAYYNKKLSCEEMIAASSVPNTILRATQFHELIALVLQTASRLPVVPLPLDFRFQPIAAAETADRLAELAGAGPAGRVPDIGGPEVCLLEDLVDSWRQHRGRPRRAVRLPLPGRVARGFRQGDNTCPDRAVGTVTWDQFLRRSFPS